MDNPASPKQLAGRYEVRQVLGQGGMGLVYRAYDTVVRREVAVKTILDIPDPASLQLFYKECDVLASMSHPNIVEIFDIGEFEEDGKKKPYFVMPLLPGATLDQPIQRFASLTIQGGVPGTTVLIDQTAVGTVQSDGTLTVATVNPGDHIVELRKDRFKPRQIRKSFVVGTAVSLAAADAALEVAPADLKITFTPIDAQVTLGKAGETPAKVSSGSTMSLSAGSYIFTVKTVDNITRSSTVEVVAGQSRSLDLPLGPTGMTKWDDPESWKPENGAFVHKGGDFVMYNLAPTSGTFVFSAMLAKGRRLQWMLNCVDANNYVLFQMDENNFYRTVVRNGETFPNSADPCGAE
jgi:hypothetical protein